MKTPRNNTNSDTNKSPSGKKLSKEERLAQALRANLRRRKQAHRPSDRKQD
ncbi:MAG: hypothetical protein ACWA5L_05510 [bacterium]